MIAVESVFGALLGATLGLALGCFVPHREGRSRKRIRPYAGAVLGALVGGLIAGAVFPREPSYTASARLLSIESSEEFQQQVLEADMPVLAEFYATWCRPCLRMEPSMHALADRFAGIGYVAKVNAERLDHIASNHDIDGVPVLIVFVDGREAERTVGCQSDEQLAALLQRHLSSQAP